jgi:uncharacterized protein (TIGR03000 family)
MGSPSLSLSAFPYGYNRGSNLFNTRNGLYGLGYGFYGGFGGYGYGWGGYGYDDYYGNGTGNVIDFLDYGGFSFPFYTPTNQASTLPLEKLPNDHPNTARLMVEAPLGSDVWLSGKKIDMGGSSVKIFESPELKKDEVYTVDVRVSWDESGKTTDEKRTLTMKPGEFMSLQYFGSPSPKKPDPKP